MRHNRFMTAWQVDVLGPEFQFRTLPLGEDDEGPVEATLVRRVPSRRRSARAVLYIHGWSDYFFQANVAAFFTDQAIAFYALDLRKYGRSLRDYQSAGYVNDLATYDEDIAAALEVIRAENGSSVAVAIMGHSTGGLVASLWADRHPGEIAALILNSPWLETQGSSLLRHLSAPVVARLASFQPKAALPNVDPGHYHRVCSASAEGQWTYNEVWRPNPMFPVRAGWLATIFAGHERVARGLNIQVPVLVLVSSQSIISIPWHDDMVRADTVIDVNSTALRATLLGPTVTLVRITDGLHDLALSSAVVTKGYFAAINRWMSAYY